MTKNTAKEIWLEENLCITGEQKKMICKWEKGSGCRGSLRRKESSEIMILIYLAYLVVRMQNETFDKYLRQ